MEELAAEVPPEVVTVTGTVPTPPGEVTVIEVPFVPTETFVPGVEPKDTVELELNPAPVMVTVVPPVASP